MSLFDKKIVDFIWRGVLGPPAVKHPRFFAVGSEQENWEGLFFTNKPICFLRAQLTLRILTRSSEGTQFFPVRKAALKSLFAGAALDFNAALRTGKNYVPSKDRVKMRSLSWALQKHIGLLVKNKPSQFIFISYRFWRKNNREFRGAGS